eukprot:4440912-Amphidinium_carterae.3
MPNAPTPVAVSSKLPLFTSLRLSQLPRNHLLYPSGGCLRHHSSQSRLPLPLLCPVIAVYSAAFFCHGLRFSLGSDEAKDGSKSWLSRL